MPLSFENALGGGFNMTATAVLKELPSLPGQDLFNPDVITPNPNAIQRDLNAEVFFTWNLTGPGFAMLMPQTWRFDVFLERMGIGEGPTIPLAIAPFVGTIGTYSASCPIPRLTVPVGLYRVTARMMLLPGALTPATAFDNLVSGMVAFEDLGMVQFYNM
jgi:hypothetical protein